MEIIGAKRNIMEHIYTSESNKKSQINSLKAGSLVLIALFFSLASFAQVCSNPSGTIYGLDGNGNIYPISVSNAAVSAAINTPLASPNQPNAIGYDNVNGLFYFFQSNPDKFVSYDPTTATYATLASPSGASTIRTGCVSFGGTGYYCSDVNGVFYYYNITANTWTTITSSIIDNDGNNVSTTVIKPGQGSGDMAVDGLGNLWMVTSSSTNWGLYEMPAPLPTTAQATVQVTEIIAPTSSVPAGGNPFGGIAFSSTGTIYMSTSTELFVLQNTSTLSLIGTLTTTGAGDDLTSCNFPTSILPVTWESFSGNAVNDNTNVELNWVIAQQVNNKGFYIQQSPDGKNWVDAGFVPGVANDPNQASFSFTDFHPVAGVNYYRIMQVDLDGKENYSKTITVNINNNSQVTVWPNPASDIIHINNTVANGGASSKAIIYDISGRIVFQGGLQAGGNSIEVSALPRGTYVLTVHQPGGAVSNQKLIIQRP